MLFDWPAGLELAYGFFFSSWKNFLSWFFPKISSTRKIFAASRFFLKKRPKKIRSFAAIFKAKINGDLEGLRKFLAPQAKIFEFQWGNLLFSFGFSEEIPHFRPPLRNFSSRTPKYPMLPPSRKFPQLPDKFPQFPVLRFREKKKHTRDHQESKE